MSDAPPTPSAPRHAASVHELRRRVSARHKILASQGPADAAVTLIAEEYGVDLASGAAFVAWLRDAPGHEDPPPRELIERRHTAWDPSTGQARHLDTEPGSIPPRPGGSQPARRARRKGR